MLMSVNHYHTRQYTISIFIDKKYDKYTYLFISSHHAPHKFISAELIPEWNLLKMAAEIFNFDVEELTKQND